MDSTVIEEIAEQLGMAVDQASAFIADHLPDYAAMMATRAMFPIQFGVVLLLVLSAVAVLSYVLSGGNSDNDFFVMSSVGAVVLFVLLAIYVFIVGPDIVGWSQYPEAMLIDKVLGHLG